MQVFGDFSHNKFLLVFNWFGAWEKKRSAAQNALEIQMNLCGVRY